MGGGAGSECDDSHAARRGEDECEAGTQPGTKLRLRGKGLPTGKDGHGDLYVTVVVEFPEEVTEEEKALWISLAEKNPLPPPGLNGRSGVSPLSFHEQAAGRRFHFPLPRGRRPSALFIHSITPTPPQSMRPILALSLLATGLVQAAPPNLVVFLADDAGGGLLLLGQHPGGDAEHRLDREGRRLPRSLLRLSRLLADPGGVPHGPLPSAHRGQGSFDGAGADEPRRADDRGGLPGGGLRDGRLRQMAQRLAMAVSSHGAGFRHLLRPQFGPLGGVFRRAARG